MMPSLPGIWGSSGRKSSWIFWRNKISGFLPIHKDCGILIYDDPSQDTHAGGSGCGCSAAVLASYILPKIVSGEWKRILFVPTGALLSKVSFNEGDSIPGIAHGVVIEHMEV